MTQLEMSVGSVKMVTSLVMGLKSASVSITYLVVFHVSLM